LVSDKAAAVLNSPPFQISVEPLPVKSTRPCPLLKAARK
jgi:hypothetical protein